MVWDYRSARLRPFIFRIANMILAEAPAKSEMNFSNIVFLTDRCETGAFLVCMACRASYRAVATINLIDFEVRA
ncbi:hypothetical protein BIY28_16275 [Brenneria goodwinii]|nr:hypothetical protein BIY28_16275 [Brenneria goodwinii]